MTGRSIEHEYRDPLEVVWLGLLTELGFKLERSHEVFAAFDGQHTLTLCAAEHFDADDSLAQMVLHELCHALVAGDAGRNRPDWGLENATQRDLIQEHACHRLQAQLSGEYGLRDFFAVTTDHRSYWDSLGLDVLADTPNSAPDPSIERARLAYHRACNGPWAEPLRRALQATQALASIARDFAGPGSLWSRSREMHPGGFARHADASLKCAGCAWFAAEPEADEAANQPPRGRGFCYRAASKGGAEAAPSIASTEPACERFEVSFDIAECARCGACCREGFHRVELEQGEPFERRHLSLVSRDQHGAYVARPGGKCVALHVGADSAHRCRVYAERPQACADFAIRGAACLEARRRVGLSI